MLKKLIPHAIAIVLFGIASAIFFLPQVQGQKLVQGDIVQHQAMAEEIRKHNEETGKKALWTNSIFGGMPTYQISLTRDSNLVYYVHLFFMRGISGPIGMVMIAMLSFYILARVLELEFWTSIVCAIAFALTTNNIVLMEAGHNSKVMTVYLLGIATAGILQAFKGKWLEGSILFAFGFAYNIFMNHPQMTYYYGLTVLILGAIQLARHIKEGRMQEFYKPMIGLVVAAILGLAASASGLLTTLEYKKSSMRGAPILTTQNANSSSSAVEGLDWEYAQQWSNGTIDLVAGFIPGAAGGGSAEPVGTDSESYKVFRQEMSPLYWGKLPFTSGPAYLGCVLVFLFLLGMLIKDTPYKWWIGASVLLTLMLSMGKHLEWFNRIFFEYFPLYNSFRAHSSVLSVTSFFIPLMGVITLSRIVKKQIETEELLFKGKIALSITGAICLFFALMGPSFFDFVGQGDGRYQAQIQTALIADRKDLMSSDAWRALIMILISAGAIWAYTKDMINSKVLIAIVGFIIIFDMWSVDRRYINDDNWSSAAQYESNFTMRPVDQQILQDPDPHYRVMDRSINFIKEAIPARYHKLIAGYHPVKLQRTNDLLYNHIVNGNQQAVNMLNAKYIIGGQPGQEQVSRNPGAYGNAWFVDNVTIVPDAQAESDALQNLTSNDAFVHQEFSGYIGGLDPNKNGTIQLTSYSPNTLTYSSNTNSEQLAVFSEIWYEPGWKVTIDGNPVDHIRANYALRALKIPAGQHEVVFDFHPSSYYTGRIISWIASGLIFLGLGWMGFKGFQKLQQDEVDILTKPDNKAIAQPKPTVAKKKKKITKKKKK